MVFEEVGLNWRDHVMVDESLYRPSEIAVGRGRPYNACAKLGWQVTYGLRDVAKGMIAVEL